MTGSKKPQRTRSAETAAKARQGGGKGIAPPSQGTPGAERSARALPAPAAAVARAVVAVPPVDAAALDAARVESAVRVLRRFRAVFNAVKSHFQQVEKQAGIGGAQLWALSLVEAQPGIGVGALARQMDVHQTTASNLVRSLVEQGLVASQRSGADRRATELRSTRSAARVLARAPGPFAGVLPDALKQLDASTLSRLDADLQQLLHLLATDRKAERIPLAEL
jgi:DNA-binding MarR family transcriptional regulator